MAIDTINKREDARPVHTNFVSVVAERFINDNPDLSAEMRVKVHEAEYSSTTVEAFWKKLEEYGF